MLPIKPLLSLLSPALARGRLSLLIFHRVLPRSDPIFPGEVDAGQFDQILGWLRAWCNVLPLDQAVARLKSGSLPARAAAITFDDGYADNHDVALPLLARHGLPACFFIATGFLDGGRMWNDTVIEALRRCRGEVIDLRGLGLPEPSGDDRWALTDVASRRRVIESVIGRIKYVDPAQRQLLADAVAVRSGAQLPDDLMMTRTQVRKLCSAGMQIGAHTHSHPILARLPAQDALQEIRQSKESLEQLLDQRIDLFAYPNGRPGKDYDQTSVDLVRQLGFAAAVSTAVGAADAAADPLQLPRFTPWDRTRTRFGLRLASNLWSARAAAH